MISFNPCCFWKSSWKTIETLTALIERYVSILVVLEVVLEEPPGPPLYPGLYPVSILVVLEVVLEVTKVTNTTDRQKGFNPCCSGSRPGSLRHRSRPRGVWSVSILVVLEVVLEVIQALTQLVNGLVSILVVLEVVLEGPPPTKHHPAPKSFQSLLFWKSSWKQPIKSVKTAYRNGFNPCCSGSRPGSCMRMRRRVRSGVSILVVLEVVLEAHFSKTPIKIRCFSQIFKEQNMIILKAHMIKTPLLEVTRDQKLIVFITQPQTSKETPIILYQS